MLNKDSFIKFMHMATSVRDWPRRMCNKLLHSTMHNSLETRITPS